jgi:hypothetical protein
MKKIAMDHIQDQVESSLDLAVTELHDFIEGQPEMGLDDNRQTMDNLLEQYYIARRAQEVWYDMRGAYR